MITRLLELFRKRGSVPLDGRDTESLPNKALIILFANERANAFRAAEKRRAGGSSSSFQVVEDCRIILLQGRKYDEGTEEEPSILKMNSAHIVLPEVQRAAYSAPLLPATSALGRSTAEAIHDTAHGESASSTNARASRYWHYQPGNLPFFKHLADSCFTCRQILQRRGRDVILPLRSLGDTSLLEGHSLMVDVAGPWSLLCKPREASTTREATRTGRDKLKLYVLLSICMYSHRISCSVMDSLNTDSLTSALHKIFMEHGWRSKELAFDAGSSLVPAIENTVEGLRLMTEEEEQGFQEEHDLDADTAAEVVRNLTSAGYKLRPVRSKASYRQSSIESSI